MKNIIYHYYSITDEGEIYSGYLNIGQSFGFSFRIGFPILNNDYVDYSTVSINPGDSDRYLSLDKKLYKSSFKKEITKLKNTLKDKPNTSNIKKLFSKYSTVKSY